MDLLMPHSGTLIWMLIAFITVFLILKKFAWKPILNALKQRENSIEEALLAAEAAKQDMVRLKSDNEAILNEAKQERDKIIKEARGLKDSLINDAKKQAGVEAEKIIEAARNAIKSEKDAAIGEMREQAAILSIQIAEKLLKEKLVSESEQNALIEKLLRDVKLN